MSKKACQISLDGELTIYRAEVIKAKLLPVLEKCSDVEIDLSQVSEMDTAGMQVLMAAKLECTNRGKNLRLIGHSPAVVEVLDILNVAHFFGDAVVIPSGAH